MSVVIPPEGGDLPPMYGPELPPEQNGGADAVDGAVGEAAQPQPQQADRQALIQHLLESPTPKLEKPSKLSRLGWAALVVFSFCPITAPIAMTVALITILYHLPSQKHLPEIQKAVDAHRDACLTLQNKKSEWDNTKKAITALDSLGPGQPTQDEVVKVNEAVKKALGRADEDLHPDLSVSRDDLQAKKGAILRALQAKKLECENSILEAAQKANQAQQEITAYYTKPGMLAQLRGSDEA